MDHPPPLLAVKGKAAVFRLPAIAIVGARNASLAGIKMARMLAADLGRDGYGIVSGLARGIDTAAHQGSLSTGTIGVLAGGLDLPYPPENAGLCDEIAERGGAIISEMPFGWQPRAQDFPRRNRLVAGAALGLVVVEAAQRSGSLISARLAGEMGRLVFAVPGSPLDPRAAGTNGLLKDGATLVTEAADISSAIAPLAGTRAPRTCRRLKSRPTFRQRRRPARDDRARVIEALGPTPVAVDEIIRHTGLHPAQVFMVLLELDLAGRLERHAGGNVSLVFGQLPGDAAEQIATPPDSQRHVTLFPKLVVHVMKINTIKKQRGPQDFHVVEINDVSATDQRETKIASAPAPTINPITNLSRDRKGHIRGCRTRSAASATSRARHWSDIARQPPGTVASEAPAPPVARADFFSQ